jgi:hypothetical protein
MEPQVAAFFTVPPFRKRPRKSPGGESILPGDLLNGDYNRELQERFPTKFFKEPPSGDPLPVCSDRSI